MTQAARLQASFFGRRGGRVPTAHQQFLDLSCQRYHAMADRFAERRTASGHVVRVGRELPFGLEGYREWLRALLGGEEGVCQCVYCGAHLTVHNLVTEHRVPPDRGGELGLENLAASCSNCNQQKGMMTDIAYVALRHFADQLPSVDRTDLLGRLQIAIKLAVKSRQDQVRRAKQQEVSR